MDVFLKHVKEGLSKPQKSTSSRYFYDEKGDQLFQQIMQLDEYYLPKCEMQIITHQSKEIADDLAKKHKNIQIVELGAGDGTKTKHLLSQFKSYFESLEYVALDISETILDFNKKEVEKEVSGINIHSIAGNYFKTFSTLPSTKNRRLVLFLGGNIGNFLLDEAVTFFEFIQKGLKENDALLVAFDLVKHPRKILAAYDDKKGVTKAFNLNLLTRMNRELGANFDISKFDHFPFYNPMTGITTSHIISLEKQTVQFQDGFEVSFNSFEAIHTEISKKYFPKDIEYLADKSDMQITKTYYHTNKEYAFVLFSKKQRWPKEPL